MDLGELIIADSNGKVVYLDPHGGIEAGMLFVWRDLLLSSIVHSPNDTLAKKLVAEIESLGLSSEMLKRLDDEIMRRWKVASTIVSCRLTFSSSPNGSSQI